MTLRNFLKECGSFFLALRNCLALIFLTISIQVAQAHEFSDKNPLNADGPLAMIGDTQRTMWIEQYLLFREQNDDIRPKIIAALVREKPSVTVFNGDLVAVGGDPNDWSYFDQLVNPIFDLGIPAWPVWGNHEYFTPLFSTVDPLPLFKARFAAPVQDLWYWRTWQNLALIFLNSNDTRLGKKWDEQKTWLRDTLANLDKNSAIKGIIFFSHHPVFSNSLVPGTGDHEKLKADILPLFLQSKKSILYMSSHAHGFQHFQEYGKTFLVSGGGGGPRAEMAPKFMAKHQDLYSSNWKRPFNFVLLRMEEKSLVIDVKGLEKTDDQAKTIDHFKIALP